MAYDPNKNAKLKGRRRFKADLADVNELCVCGYMVQGLTVKKVAVDEDEDGSFQITIVNHAKERVLSATFTVTDTSEYPQSHSFFCYTDDANLPPGVQSLLEDMVDQRPRVVKDLLDWFCSSLSRALAPNVINVDATSDEESEDDSYFEYEDDMDLDTPVEPNAILQKLQTDFVDIVASSYKPGIIRTGGGNDFIISVSIPVAVLAQIIPPRALMAWDRSLLSKYQRLTLLISGFRGLYPVICNDGAYTSNASKLGVSLEFKVGLTEKYKPGKDQAQDAVRKHGLVQKDAEDELRMKEAQAALEHEYERWDDTEWADEEPVEEVVEVEEPSDPDRFDRFSLTSSLESLFESSFLRVAQLRRQFGLNWAGAELLFSETEKRQQSPEEVYAYLEQQIKAADKREDGLGRTSLSLPHDPLRGLGKDQNINLPLTAFSYLLRRLTLCTKYCVVCHNQLESDFEALKPYVCGNKLCSFQYYAMGRGPSLEYEIIHNPRTVDLLVSLAYVSAVEGSMDDPLPVGLGLQVPHPGDLGSRMYMPEPSRMATFPPATTASTPSITQATTPIPPSTGGLVDFDQLSKQQMRAVIAKLIDSLPSIEDMKKHLTQKVTTGKSKPKLQEIDPAVLPAAWLILRWIVGSCTAYIEEITSGDEQIKNLDPNWRQFRLTVGAPDAEAKFKAAVVASTRKDKNASKFPVLYAFHGSPLKNWHSIVRHGLWYKDIAHGRAYGNGVYLAKDGNVSMGSYAVAARTAWRKSQTSPTNCVALAEVVNLPKEFVSHNPYFVVADTTWIMCRYLLLKGAVTESTHMKPVESVPYVQLDPAHPTTLNNNVVSIPDPNRQLESLLQTRLSEVMQEEDADEEDLAVFNAAALPSPSNVADEGIDHMDVDDDDEDDYKIAPRPEIKKAKAPQRPADDWQHDPKYVQGAIENLLLPPFESSTSASMAVQRELRDMFREQESARSLKELGWYISQDLMGDNLYQWIVEMHSFDLDIPIAKDMKAKNINSIIFEIRFPPTFPNSPPFFRVITPRFLPFIHGGGGHVTGGGSICMDLLTADGWLPSYSIPAVIMQIKLAISNLEPKPARLAANWNTPYGVRESVEGFRRAAATHNWKVPEGLDRLMR